MSSALGPAVRRALVQRRERLSEIDRSLTDADVLGSPDRLRTLTRERGPLARLIEAFDEFEKNEEELAGCRELLEDPEMAAEAEGEIGRLEARQGQLAPWLEGELLQADEDSGRDVIIEIRAGTGGDEAALFCGDLHRMYQRFCQARGWKIDPISQSPGESGGFKEVSFQVDGEEVYRHLQFESGGHRVQRVPQTESQGRIHTSLVTVAVMPQVEEVEVDIDPNDLRIDVMRASGPGGQSVNTTDSAVRITHEPTGLVVICMDEKSQIKNKAKAMGVLRSRLYVLEQERVKSEHDALRKSQVGSGDRSERIRTYNFPQGRCTDHRLGESLYSLDAIMEGELDGLMELLQAWDREQKIAALSDE